MGLALIIVGGLVVRDVSNINKDHVRLVLDSITVGNSKLGGLVSTLSILMILIGVLILAVTGLGLFGIFCQNKYMLITVSTTISSKRKCHQNIYIYIFIFIYLNLFDKWSHLM